MKTKPSPQAAQRTMLLRSMYVLMTPVFLLFAIFACATPLTGLPVYTCPTAAPPPTSTVLAGTPLPTLAPLPTPFVIRPPQPFYVGDAIFVTDASARVRFRLQHVGRHPADASDQPQNIYSWQLQVKNIGTQDYQIFPMLQMILSEIQTISGPLSDVWPATRLAAEALALPVHDGVYTLTPGDQQTFQFATLGPAGQAKRFTFTLDPTMSIGSAVITWIHADNPYCSGDIRDP